MLGPSAALAFLSRWREDGMAMVVGVTGVTGVRAGPPCKAVETAPGHYSRMTGAVPIFKPRAVAQLQSPPQLLPARHQLLQTSTHDDARFLTRDLLKRERCSICLEGPTMPVSHDASLAV